MEPTVVYTTGEIARLCGVSVRTVQYYDTRGILVPEQLSEGGRRLYTEEQVGKLKLICFLRDLDISIQDIGLFLSQESSEDGLSRLLEQQRDTLVREIADRRRQLSHLDELCRNLKEGKALDAVAISDLATIAASKKRLRHLRAVTLCWGFVMDAIEVAVLCLGLLRGIWWPCIPGLAAVITVGIGITCYYFKHVAYLCPHCHTVFRPGLKSFLGAHHTPNTRRLTCTTCGRESDCREIATVK